ncbi:MAG: capsule assembly Wzi family protein [Tannerella sp.]|jgi:hypothetical protein|nr:capsule assembly Wzi family protein [Tannerella sp.]
MYKTGFHFRSVLAISVAFCCLLIGQAQDNDRTVYHIQAFGSASSGGQTPFWMVSNREGIVPVDANNGYLRAGIFSHKSLGNHFEWQAGGDIVFVAPRYKNVYIHQLYTALSYRNIHLSIGSRSGYKYHLSTVDPSLSSGDMGMSTNARPIPEVNLFLPEYVTIPWTKGWLQGRGHFAIGRSFDTDYLSQFNKTDQFYVQNVLWHHKSLYARIKDTQNGFPVSMVIGLRHIAQWGGVSTNPKLGNQPHSIKDLLRIMLGKSGGDNASLSDQINALGAHTGTYDIRMGYEKQDWAVFAYYQDIFSDASGMELYNLWDGLKGIQLNLNKMPWLSKIVLEYMTTLNQSGPFHFIDFDHDKYPGYGGGADNYYNNGEYTTGTSYFNRSLGSPLLISPAYNTDGAPGFKHTRVRAWHTGIEGQIIHDLSYRLLVTHMESFGTPFAPTIEKLKNTSFTTDFSYHFCNSWKVTASLAADRGNLLGNHFGCGLSVSRQGSLFGGKR